MLNASGSVTCVISVLLRNQIQISNCTLRKFNALRAHIAAQSSSGLKQARYAKCHRCNQHYRCSSSTLFFGHFASFATLVSQVTPGQCTRQIRLIKSWSQWKRLVDAAAGEAAGVDVHTLPLAHWNAIHCTKAFAQLCRLVDTFTPKLRWNVAKSQPFRSLINRTHSLTKLQIAQMTQDQEQHQYHSDSNILNEINPESSLRYFSGREISTLIYTFATVPLPIYSESSSHELIKNLLTLFVDFESIHSHSDTYTLSNLLWSLSEIQHRENATLFEQQSQYFGGRKDDVELVNRVTQCIAKQFEMKLKQMTNNRGHTTGVRLSQDISNLLTGFVAQHYYPATLMQALAEQLLTLTPQQWQQWKELELWNTIYSFVFLQCEERSKSQSQSQPGLQFDAEFKSSLTTLEHELVLYRQTYACLLQSSTSRIAHFQPQGLAMISWSIGKIAPLLFGKADSDSAVSVWVDSAEANVVQQWFTSLLVHLNNPSSTAFLETFKPADRSNLLWAIAQIYSEQLPSQILFESGQSNASMLRDSEPKSFHSLVQQLLSQMVERFLHQPSSQWTQWKMQELSSTISSIVKIQLGIQETQSVHDHLHLDSYRQLYEQLIAESIKRIDSDKFDSQAVSNFSWSIVKIAPFLLGSDLPANQSLSLSVSVSRSESGMKFRSSVIHEWFTTLLSHLIHPSSTILLKQFTPQGRSNLVWSLAQLYSDWQPHELFYPLLHRFLLHMAESMLDPRDATHRTDPFAGFSGQSLANFALSYADLRSYHSRLMEHLVVHLCATPIAHHLNDQYCANLLLAFAKLGMKSVPLSTAIATRLIELLQGDGTKVSSQGLVNSCWSFAVSNHLQIPIVHQFVTEATHKLDQIDAQQLPVTRLIQLHQLQLSLLSLSVPPSLSESSPLVSSPTLLSQQLAAMCRQAINIPLNQVKSIKQQEVERVLEQLGIDFEAEYLIPECGYRVDFYVTDARYKRNGLGSILEYHGPNHYVVDLISTFSATYPNSDSSTSPSSPSFTYNVSGPDLLVGSHLAAAGYRVNMVPYFDFNSRTWLDKIDLVKEKLNSEVLDS